MWVFPGNRLWEPFIVLSWHYIWIVKVFVCEMQLQPGDLLKCCFKLTAAEAGGSGQFKNVPCNSNNTDTVHDRQRAIFWPFTKTVQRGHTFFFCAMIYIRKIKENKKKNQRKPKYPLITNKGFKREGCSQVQLIIGPGWTDQQVFRPLKMLAVCCFQSTQVSVYTILRGREVSKGVSGNYWCYKSTWR